MVAGPTFPKLNRGTKHNYNENPAGRGHPPFFKKGVPLLQVVLLDLES
jgi:hypothetical protein